QVIITVLSADLANPYDIPGINAAGLAVTLAGLPFDGPVAAARVGLIGGQWRLHPTYQDLDLATFDVVVAGRLNDQGQVDILMVEGEAPEGTWERLEENDGTSPTEDVVGEGLEVAKAAIAEIIAFQRELVAEAGVTAAEFEPRPLYSSQTWSAVEAFAGPRLADALVTAKKERNANLDRLKEDLREHLAA